MKMNNPNHDDIITSNSEPEVNEPVVADDEVENYVKSYDFLQRQAMRMARWPKTHFWVAFAVSLILSISGFYFGDFSVTTESGGWWSRGTLIANRQTQLMISQAFQDYLFHDKGAWEDLMSTVQPGWEKNSDDPRDRRRMQEAGYNESPAVEALIDPFKHLQSNSDFSLLYEKSPPSKITTMNKKMIPLLIRRLQQQESNSNIGNMNNDDGGIFSCDWGWYTDGRMESNGSYLSPVWKTEMSHSAFDSDVLEELCLSEESTQRFLEDSGLCFGCKEGCLPPFSIVFYIRLIVPGGMEMECSSLADTWSASLTSSSSLKSQQIQDWQLCVKELEKSDNIHEMPDSCGALFQPSLLDEFFDTTGSLHYTSSIFATKDDMVEELYDNILEYDKGGHLVEGAYDTANQDFVNLLAETSVGSDMSLAAASAFITSIAILVHTRSFFLTLVGLIQIILSFPLAFFVYTFFGQLNFFPFLNFIGVFVVFALGADHVFVAVDKWKNARIKHPFASTEEVAAMALPDAAGAMFLTTSTTAVAFFGTAICPVAPVKLFAIFCGLLIVFDYLMDIFLVFPCLCIYDKKRHNGSCCCRSQKNDSNNNDQQCEDKELNNEELNNEEEQSSDGESNNYQEDEKTKNSLIRRILSGYYDFLHRFRWPLFVISIVSLIASSYYATKLELPTSSEVRLLSPKIEYEKAAEWRTNLLSAALQKRGGSHASVIWGVSPADTGDHNDPETWSQLVLDDSFDPGANAAAQIYMRDFCSLLFDQDFAKIVAPNYECPINRFDQWLQNQSELPVNAQDTIYTSQCGTGANSLPLPRDVFHRCLVAWSKQTQEKSILSRDGTVTIISVTFRSQARLDSSNAELRDEWETIEDWMATQMKKAPREVSGAYFSSIVFWWYDTNAQMFKTAYGGVAIALAAAAVVILLSSRSVVMTLFSVISITYVLTSVTALMAAIGWTLGFLESICFAILIGVSVDFVIHFSHAYVSPTGHGHGAIDIDRTERTKFALIHMGPSILAAAFTTVSGASIMLFTVITFFQKFAIVLFLTIVQATTGSFVVFLTLTDCIGPSNPTNVMDRIAEAIVQLKYKIIDCCTATKEGQNQSDIETPKSQPAEISTQRSDISNVSGEV